MKLAKTTKDKILSDTRRMTTLAPAITVEELKTRIDAFEMLLNLPEKVGQDGKSSAFNDVYGDFLNDYYKHPTSSDLWKANDQYMLNFEGFLRKLLKTVDFEAYDSKKGFGDDFWSCTSLCDKLGKDRNFRDTGVFGSYYKLVINTLRNTIEHKEVVLDTYTDQGRRALMTAIMDLLGSYYHGVKNSTLIAQLWEQYEKQNIFDLSDFCRRTINGYTGKDIYVETRWIDRKSGEAARNIFEVAGKQENKYAKITGHPGTGKTESMRYAQYSICRDFIIGKSENCPVMIKLADLKEMTIREEIARQLGTDDEKLENLLVFGKLRLFLDGYNEVLTFEQRERIQREITKIKNGYPEVSIWVSDRMTISKPDPLPGAGVFEQEPLGEEKAASLIERHTAAMYPRDQKWITARLITRGRTLKLKEGFEWLGKYATPFMIISVIQMIAAGEPKVSRGDYDSKYLDFLLKREKAEKDEPFVDFMADMLELIAEQILKNQDEGKVKDPEQADCITEGMAKRLMMSDPANDCDRPKAQHVIELALAMNIIEHPDNIDGGERILRFIKNKYLLYFGRNYIPAVKSEGTAH